MTKPRPATIDTFEAASKPSRNAKRDRNDGKDIRAEAFEKPAPVKKKPAAPKGQAELNEKLRVAAGVPAVNKEPKPAKAGTRHLKRKIAQNGDAISDLTPVIGQGSAIRAVDAKRGNRAPRMI